MRGFLGYIEEHGYQYRIRCVLLMMMVLCNVYVELIARCFGTLAASAIVKQWHMCTSKGTHVYQKVF